MEYSIFDPMQIRWLPHLSCAKMILSLCLRNERESMMKTRNLAITATMLAIALVFQLGFAQFSQPLVGPLVNMTLFLTTALVGIPAGILVGCCTPVAAFVLGIMPVLPLLPVVAVGNVMLVLLFGLVRYLAGNRKQMKMFRIDIPAGNRKQMKMFRIDIPAVVVAALGKFAVLALAIRLFVPLFIPNVAPKIVEAFSLPQLFTALIGGAVALLLLRLLPAAIVNRRENK